MDLLKQEIVKALEKAGVKNPRLEKPPESIDADLSLPCFELAKELKKSPVEIAKDLSGKLKIKHIKEIKPLGPYVNFYIDWEKIGSSILEEILKKKEKYGQGSEKESVIIDTYNANPFKNIHIGHVRNAILGESVRRLLEFTGRKTTPVTYNGDVGIHVARWLLYHKFSNETIPKKDFSKWVGQIYAASANKAKDSEEFENEAQELNRKLDKRDPELVNVWKKFRDLCYADYKKIAKEIGIKIDHNIPESTCEEPGKEKVAELFKEGKIVESNGALGVDLEKYGLGFFMLLKSDGTALYSTKDFGLLYNKRKLGNFDKYLYVVGSEQEFYFKQLFKAYEILDMPDKGKHHHVSYGLVDLKEGKMSSRLGNVILYEDLRDEMVKMALEQIEAKNPDLKNKERVAKQVAFAAIKFQMLCIENHKFIKFDWDQALDINGRSGPYLQYTIVRANKILEKEKSSIKFDGTLLKEKPEIELLKRLAEFPEVVKKSADSYSPYMLTTYLFELAQNFNTFYQSSPVLQAETKLKQARMALVKSVSIVLKTGLNLLGIDVPEEM